MKVVNKSRNDKVAELHSSGQSFAEIGRSFGVTRERVRQIVSLYPGCHEKYFINRKAGRKATKTRLREQDDYCLRVYGCLYAEVLAVEPYNRGRRGSICRKYCSHKSSAKCRGIDFDLTLPQWWFVWNISGHFGDHGFCMARFGDIGAYEIDNVYITTIGQNIRDYHSNKKIS